MFQHNLVAKKINDLEYNVKSGYIKVDGWGIFNTELKRFVTMRSDNLPTAYSSKKDIISIITQYDGSEIATKSYNELKYAELDRNGN